MIWSSSVVQYPFWTSGHRWLNHLRKRQSTQPQPRYMSRCVQETKVLRPKRDRNCMQHVLGV
eukprot:6208952-Pleurochrysis_carterae.AAC.1